MDKTLYTRSKTENIQGPYYCGVGTGNCHLREFMEEAIQHMVDSGLNITGLNFEVAPGQAEFQIMNAGIDAADELHMARYILIRAAEQKGTFIDFHPKRFSSKNNCFCLLKGIFLDHFWTQFGHNVLLGTFGTHVGQRLDTLWITFWKPVRSFIFMFFEIRYV